jgi:hypothetical protein
MDDYATGQALRYQRLLGQGWSYVADSVRELRGRLLSRGNADAAP